MNALERNKGVILAVLAAADRGDFETVQRCLSPSYVDHSATFGSRAGAGRVAATESFRQLAAAFPDVRHTVLDLIAEGDKVALRVSATATHEAEFRGVPPTGRCVSMTQTVIYRLRDGLIEERWVDGAESVVDRLTEASPPLRATSHHDQGQVRVLRPESTRWSRDASGGEYWELRLRDASLTCFRLPAGASFPAHAHDAEQITLVLEGQLTFEFEQDRQVLGPGDAVAVPARVRHAVAAGPAPVLAVDAWSPPPEHLGQQPARNAGRCVPTTGR